MQGLVNGGDAPRSKLYVDNGSKDLDNLSCVLAHDNKVFVVNYSGGLLAVLCRGGNFENFLSDGCLAGFIVLQR